MSTIGKKDSWYWWIYDVHIRCFSN